MLGVRSAKGRVWLLPGAGSARGRSLSGVGLLRVGLLGEYGLLGGSCLLAALGLINVREGGLIRVRVRFRLGVRACFRVRLVLGLGLGLGLGRGVG